MAQESIAAADRPEYIIPSCRIRMGTKETLYLQVSLSIL